MKDSGRGHQQLFAELKRRKVFRVIAVYGATAFVVLQAADLLAEGMGLSDQVLRVTTFLVLLGFPMAIVLAWAFETTPEGVRRTEDATDEEIAAIIAQPASRRWPAGLLALLGATLLFGAWWMGRQTGADKSETAEASSTDVRLAFADSAADPRPSIVVLPFADISPEGDQEYFSDGMTDEIMNVLVKVGEFRVPARTSAFTYKGQDKDAKQIGSELGVSYLVEGSIRKAGDMLRITAQLIDAETDEHLWSNTYDRELTAANVFDIQSEIAVAIADALTVPLGLEDASDLVTPTGDLEAYDLYLAGRTRMRERGESLREAISLFEAAIARDSAWAPAWASLAEANELKIWYSDGSAEGFTDSRQFVREAHDTAERAARRALELDPDNGSALVALANVQRNRAQWEAAEETYRRALAVDPEYAEAHHQYADLRFNVGRIDEAVRALDKAYALDPAPVRGRTLTWALILDDRAEQALVVAEYVLERTAEPGPRRRMISDAVEAAIRAGKMEKALDLIDQERVLDPDPGPLDIDLDSAAWRARNAAALRSLTAGNPELWPEEIREWIDPWMWMVLGDPDRAVTELLDDLDGPVFGRAAEVWDPLYDPVRDDPRIRSFLAARGLGDVGVQRTPREQRQLPIVVRRNDP